MFYSVAPPAKKRRVHNKSAALSTLPMELLMEIVSFLDAPSKDILSFMLVCKNFYNVMEHDMIFNIWKNFYYRDFPKEAEKTVKSYYGNKDDSDSKFSWKVAFKGIYLKSKFKVFCGDYYTIFLIRQDGKRQLFGCGNNVFGQLGLGNKDIVTTLCQLKGFPEGSKILKVFCGGYHTIFLIEQYGKRQLFGCGNNIFGQLGFGGEEAVIKPCQLNGFPEGSKILKVFCGGYHTIFLIEQYGKRQLFGCGNNTSGQLGFGGEEVVIKPCQLNGFPENSKILKVFCGGCHTIFLIEQDGKRQLFGCGSNRFGQLGLGNKDIVTTLCQLKVFPEGSKILKVFCGGYRTIFLIEQDGKRQLFGCGSNHFGQLGLGDKDIVTTLCQLKGFPEGSKILDVFCGGYHTIFLIEQYGKRQLFGCGNNTSGQLGFGDEEVVIKPCQLKGFPENSKILKVFCGAYHTIFLIEQDGKRQLFSCGSNRFDQLALGGKKNRIRFCQLKDPIFNKERYLSSECTGFDDQFMPNSEMVKVCFQF